VTRDEHVFDEAPYRVYWELTRACELACRHCRADAAGSRDPGELDLEEGRRFLEALREFDGPGPHLVLTGGDPLKRPDFWTLLHHAVGLGFHVAVAPSGTPALTATTVHRLRESGVQAMSLSLDGPDAARHDGFRGVPGCFDRTVEAARAAVATGIPLQVNTLVTADTRGDLPALADLVEGLGAARWSLFFLVQLGRGRVLRQITAGACERLMRWLCRRSRDADFVATTTEAPHYRRVVLQQTRRAAGAPGGPVRHGYGIRDGNGIMFVSHTGEVQPSGFLPLTAGNVRTLPPAALYRDAPLFRQLRQPDGFRGRCGRCEFRRICGGSRARAYAATGNPLAEDPLCAYQPLGGAA
jgi:AdoMet-dependent heme synthase